MKLSLILFETINVFMTKRIRNIKIIVKKKNIWKLISFQLKDVYDENMSIKCIL